jgi:radical SAM protein with 4Fe4S-binding SPASM domain
MHQIKNLHIRITSKCNFNCAHCYAGDWLHDNCELDLSTLISVIDQACDLGCEEVTFTGGEPLLSQHLIPAIEHCIGSGLEVEIETNGVLLDQFIINAKKHLKYIHFEVSYDGDLMRNAQHTDRVLGNIEKLADLSCSVRVQTVLTFINIDEAYKIFDFSKKLGIKNRVFLSHSTNGNAKNLPLLPTKKWLKIVRDLKTKYSHLTIELPELFTGTNNKSCGWGYSRCELMPNGDITSCAPITFNKRDFVAGNIREKPLEELWNHLHFKKIRELTQADFHGLCAKCPYWKTCKGACRSMAFGSSGDILAAHPFCVAFYEEASSTMDGSTIDDLNKTAKEWLLAVKPDNPLR